MCPHGQQSEACVLCASDVSAETLIRSSPPGGGDGPELSVEALAPGQRIGRFIIVERVGQGGMGLVLSAFDPALDRRVAIKVLKPQRAAEGASGGTTRLVREAQAMAQLSHPNVVPVYDVGRLGESLFVAMEYVSGSTLHTWLTEKPRSWRDVLDMFLQAGRGLEAAHRAGIVHRDFKPLNVLVGLDGRARVTDFGLARADRNDVPLEPMRIEGHLTLDTPITIAGAVMGSPGYMAPEQYEGAATSPATDQFSFCVALYEGLYGSRPFQSNDVNELRRLARAGVVPPPPKTSTVPGWVFPLVEKGLSPEPEKRHASMTALLHALAADPSVRRRRWATVVGLALATVALPVAWWLEPLVAAQSCHVETQRRGALWTAEEQATAERAFLETKLPFAERAWELARAGIETYASSWQRERHLACDDTFVRHERSEAQLALRLRCLDRRRIEAATLKTKFVKADVEVVTQAPLALPRLTPVAVCTDVEGLEKKAALAPEDLEAVEHIEEKISEGRMLAALGRFGDARERLEAAAAGARQSQDAQVFATALLETGLLARSEERYRDARLNLDESVRVALSVGDERTALHAVAALVSLIGWRLESPKEGLALVPLARGLANRVDDPVLEALLDEGVGDASWELGDDQRSLEAYRRALALLEQSEGELSLDVARLSSSVGWLLMERGHLSEARAAYERSRATREALLGANHPEMAPTYSELGHLAYLLDEPVESVASFRRVVAVTKQHSSTGFGVVKAQENLARALALTGVFDEAQAILDDARTKDTPDFPEASRIMLNEVAALIELAKHQPAQAEVFARRALERNERQFGKQHRMTAWFKFLVGRSLLEQGKPAAALPFIDDSLSRAEADTDLMADEYVRALLAKGEALELLHRSKEAETAARKAMEAALSLDGNTTLKVKTRLSLAQVSWSLGEKARARELATEALSLAEAKARAPLVEAAKAFLDSHHE